MPVEATAIEGVLVVHQPTHSDDRGFFRQTYVTDELTVAAGRELRWRQGNHARSEPGVVRGFHTEPWDKLVYVAAGTVMAVVADVRPDSPTFGEHVSMVLGDPPGQRVRLFVAAGLANAYCVTGDRPADYLYDVTAEWHRGIDKRAVAWDDPTLAVDWPVEDPVLSESDAAAPTLRHRFRDHPLFTRSEDSR